MINDIRDFQNVFFIGIAGVGMSAIAQYLRGIGKHVSGSDRYFHEGEYNKVKHQLEVEGIQCFLQDGKRYFRGYRFGSSIYGDRRFRF